ncbi:MAG: metallophosphoesterase [Betaproteobacteria bacterium]
MTELRWLDCAPQAAGKNPPGRTPEGTVVYAVGDIHGRHDLLSCLLQGIEQDCRNKLRARTAVVYLGDYLSRGEDSRAVIDTVVCWRPQVAGQVQIVTLKGNHEDLALRYLHGEMDAGRHWFDYQGLSALAHYGVVAPDPQARDEASLLSLRHRFRQALPAQHMAFLQALAVSHDERDYRFVHAGVRPGVALCEQSAHDQMWIRQRFLESDADHGAIVVHGHSIAAQPQVRGNRIGVDTGAYASGVLTCLVLEGSERAFLQAVGAPIPDQG